MNEIIFLLIVWTNSQKQTSNQSARQFIWTMLYVLCFCQIESETSNSEDDLKDAMDRLGTLGREIDALKTKRANNSMAA